MSMEPTPELHAFLTDLFPEAGPELLRLCTGAATNANLLHADFYTIHDLLELSGYEGEQPLCALLLALLVALDEGSLCVELSEAGLSRRLADLVSEAEAAMWVKRILASLSKQ